MGTLLWVVPSWAEVDEMDSEVSANLHHPIIAFLHFGYYEAKY